jgi:hypothetical protein
MGYLGRVRPVETTASVLRSTYTGDGTTTTFNLPNNVSDETAIIATINGVVQQDAAYTTNGSQILFSAAPASGDAIELRVVSGVGLGYAPPDGSVVTGKLADGAVTNGKLSAGAAVANIGNRAILGSQLPAGTVLQVVNATYGTQVTSSTDTFVDTGLTATITPTLSTSKILVLVHQAGCFKSSSNSANMLDITIHRVGLGSIQQFAGALNLTNTTLDLCGDASAQALDSPATTSAVTYKTQFRSRNNTSSVSVQYASVSTSSITLMEIAA